MRSSVLIFRKSYQILALSASALLAAGCSDSVGVISDINTLNQRIANTLNTQPAELSYSPRPASLPRVAELKPQQQQASMSLMTSLRLGHCQAGQLIAERNSSLGRLTDGLGRLQTDVAIVNALKACVDHPESELIKQDILHAIQQKSAQLEADKQRAVATDDALRNSLRIGAKPLATIDNAGFEQSLQSLKRISDWLAEPDAATDLSMHLQRLAQSDELARLTRTVIESTIKLEQLSAQLPNLAATAGCTTQGVPERAKILRNVFMQLYVADLQPKLAELSRQYQSYHDVLVELEPTLPQPKLRRYVQTLMEWNERLKRATRYFVRPWQQFYQACGYTPGSN